MDHNVNVFYAEYLISDPQRGLNPQVENSSSTIPFSHPEFPMLLNIYLFSCFTLEHFMLYMDVVFLLGDKKTAEPYSSLFVWELCGRLIVRNHGDTYWQK